MKKLAKIFILFVTLFIISACSSNPRVQSKYSAKLDLSEYQTFNFSSPTEIENPDVSDELQLYFSAAIEQQMLLRGLVKSDAPDVLIDVSVALEDKSAAPIRENFCPRYEDYNSRYIVPIYEGQSKRTMCVYKEGTVEVNLANAKLDRTIFEGVSNVRLDDQDRGPKLTLYVMHDVATMFNDALSQVAVFSPSRLSSDTLIKARSCSM